VRWLAGRDVTAVAAEAGVHRSTRTAGRRVICWKGSTGSPIIRIGRRRVLAQVATTVEVAVAEMRREHPRWGAKRIRMELLRKPVEV